MSIEGAMNSAAQKQNPPTDTGLQVESGISARFNNNGYASAEDFLKDYKTSSFTLRDGRKIELQGLDPGDFIPIDGSPIRVMMTAAGLDFEDEKIRKKFIGDMTIEQRAELLDRHLVNVRRVVVKSVISLVFSLKLQHECGKGVVSIERLSDDDLLSIWDAIRKLSLDEIAGQDEATFQGDSSNS